VKRETSLRISNLVLAKIISENQFSMKIEVGIPLLDLESMRVDKILAESNIPIEGLSKRMLNLYNKERYLLKKV
jgi:hypothetical protein